MEKELDVILNSKSSVSEALKNVEKLHNVKFIIPENLYICSLVNFICSSVMFTLSKTLQHLYFINLTQIGS